MTIKRTIQPTKEDSPCEHPWVTKVVDKEADTTHLVCRHCLICALCGKYNFEEES